MKKISAPSFLLISVLITSFLLVGCNKTPDLSAVQGSGEQYIGLYTGATTGQRICFGTSCFSVELAITPDQRETGLMNRTSIGERSGMVFVFDQEDIYKFWMKNTLIPLDMIWLSSGMQVVDVQEAIPCTTPDALCTIYTPKAPATYVAEIGFGRAKQEGIQEGMKAMQLW